MRMKLVRVAIFGALFLLVLVLTLLILTGRSPNAPKFVPLHSPPTGSFVEMDYDWLGAVPAQDGHLWITAWSTTNWHFFLYDWTNRLVVGELLNANPVFFNQDQTKLLCEGYSLEGSWKSSVARWLCKFRMGKSLAQKINQVEAFWVLNLKDGSAEPIGKVTQFPGEGSRFLAAPGFRYGVNQPTTSMIAHELFLCDLQSNLFTRINIGGHFVGWWDERTLLVQDDTNNLVLMDVTTRQDGLLLSAAEISKLLHKMGLPSRAGDIGRARAPWLSSHWNGSTYDFFFTVAKEENWESQFLVKLDRNNRTLKLVKPDFKSHHLGFFDASATHYIYEGESGAPGRGGNGAVYIFDLSDDSVRTLIPPDNGGQYSLARFCGEGVIYMRKKLLWRVDLDGRNNMPLFSSASGARP